MQVTRKRLLQLFITGSVVLLIGGLAIAQVSTSFDLSWSGLAGGGGVRQSPNFIVQDTLGQDLAATSQSPAFTVVGGFAAGLAGAPVAGDAFEEDDGCGDANVLAVGDPAQSHDFHDVGDRDWLRFSALANKTFDVKVTKIGSYGDAVIYLHNECSQPPAAFSPSPFGNTVSLAWDSFETKDYFLEIQQFDPSFAGADTEYTIQVSQDITPPAAPTNPRCVAVSSTTLGLQWNRSPQRDVRGYRINFTGVPSGSEDVSGAATTYYELGGLTPNQTYKLRVLAVDFSGNESELSGQVECTAETPADLTLPALSLTQPGTTNIYTTTAYSLTFTGHATDDGNNLSRVQVKNMTKNVEDWDYSLSGSDADFRVADLGLLVGDNNVQVSVYDDAGNATQRAVTVRRLGQVSGAVLIVAGHNETFGLQTNIYNAANRAYRIFRSAGFGASEIQYLAPVGQDADNDGVLDTDGVSSPDAMRDAITVWAQSRVGAEKPLFIYLVDHGFTEKFCASGCDAAGAVTSADLDDWLRTLENATGLNAVTVVMEACQSGSFIDRVGPGGPESSLGKEGRVIITSTGRENNAYASAQGAYFSDAFFSCLADSNNLKVCYDQGVAAVAATGVNQTPWLDDNGDGVSTPQDGALARNRVVTRFFSSGRPVISEVKLDRQGANGTLTAIVQEGAEETALVWAAVYAPSFSEPSDVTLNLSVPTVRLEPVANQPGRYVFNYVNGFPEEGDYRIVFYAQDRLGIHAIPRREGQVYPLYLPLVTSE